ncbi:unnamed protein product [Heligmosomoides polygyrus]|uniref:Uncharacterized protein n=1 Tax=Heligmosomoides polygyrus TaxID=6339 RepID=A0A183GU30_HELPZ|nr:unnamed protein product [Heligmosomoides polygyrus]
MSADSFPSDNICLCRRGAPRQPAVNGVSVALRDINHLPFNSTSSIQSPPPQPPSSAADEMRLSVLEINSRACPPEKRRKPAAISISSAA